MRRALLTPQVNPGSLYRRGNANLRAALWATAGGKGPKLRPSKRVCVQDWGRTPLPVERAAPWIVDGDDTGFSTIPDIYAPAQARPRTLA